MPKKNKEIEDRLQTIEYLLAGILLNRTPSLKEVAKVVGCSDKTLTAMFPDRKNKKKGVSGVGDNLINNIEETGLNKDE